MDPDVVVRVDAKPAAHDGEATASDDRAHLEEVIGDPVRDRVLDKAIEQAKRRLNAGR